jgi:MerR HTH family regulatory protein
VVVVTSPDMLLTSSQAAEVAGVTKKRILQWDRRGHLERAGLNEHGWPVYRALDVAKCKQKFHGYARNEAEAEAA